MADLGLPCSPWACYEAWQNNSDRWWQMSLRARLGVRAHANKTNETLCVSFSRCRQRERVCTQRYTYTYTQECANRNTQTHTNIHTYDTCKSHTQKFLLKGDTWILFQVVSSSINAHSSPSRKIPLASRLTLFSPLPLLLHTNWESKLYRAGYVCLACVNWIQF